MSAQSQAASFFLRLVAGLLVAFLYRWVTRPQKPPPPFADVHGEVRDALAAGEEGAGTANPDGIAAAVEPHQPQAAGRHAADLQFFEFGSARAIDIKVLNASAETPTEPQTQGWRCWEARGIVNDPDELQNAGITRLSPVLSDAEVARLRSLARGLAYGTGADSVDARPTYEATALANGRVVDAGAVEALRPLVEGRLLPYLRHRHNCSSCVVCTVVIRRYALGERLRHPWHFDSEAFLTIVVPLAEAQEYVGGLYLQPGFNRSSRQFLYLRAGEAVVHDFRLRHGVEVMSGERTAMILWVKSGSTACEWRTSPWYAEAAASGDPRAQYNLGHILREGAGGAAPDAASGVAWWRRAAEQGHGLAMHNLAVAAEVGEGMPPDPEQAIFWYSKAANRGLPQSMAALGAAHRIGYGSLSPNSTTAAFWFRKAAEQGDEDAMYQLSSLLAHGEGVAADVEEARRWYELAEAQGHQDNPLRAEAAEALSKLA